MSPKRLVIVGAGGFGREVLDVVRAMDPLGQAMSFAGFVADDEPSPGLLERIGAQWLGTPDEFAALPSADLYAVCVSAADARQRLARQMDSVGLLAATLIHPTAIVGADVELGAGVVMCAQSHVTTNVRIGAHVHIDRLAQVGHDCVVGDFVTMHPATVLSGTVSIGDRTKFGTSSCVLPNLTIGSDAVIGAGAVVIDDVPDGQTVVGVPARVLRR